LHETDESRKSEVIDTANYLQDELRQLSLLDVIDASGFSTDDLKVKAVEVLSAVVEFFSGELEYFQTWGGKAGMFSLLTVDKINRCSPYG
jgi:hypothetical protein